MAPAPGMERWESYLHYFCPLLFYDLNEKILIMIYIYVSL